jgi:hypothetical protein
VKCPDLHEVAEVSEHGVVLVVASAVVELKEEYWWKKPLTALGVPAEGEVEGGAEDVRASGIVRVNDETIEGFTLDEYAHELRLEMTAPVTEAFARGEVSDDVGGECLARVHAICDGVQSAARGSACKQRTRCEAQTAESDHATMCS